MTRQIVKSPLAGVPNELQRIFDPAALVGNENPRDYADHFDSIAKAVSPANAIEWTFVKDIADLCWLIKRERMIVASMVKAAQKDVVLELLKSIHSRPDSLDDDVFRIFEAADAAELWATNCNARKEVEEELKAHGFGHGEILAKAYQKASDDIDSCEKRIEGYERRRGAILRDLGYWRRDLAKKLDDATADIIDADYTEAAE